MFQMFRFASDMIIWVRWCKKEFQKFFSQKTLNKFHFTRLIRLSTHLSRLRTSYKQHSKVFFFISLQNLFHISPQEIEIAIKKNKNKKYATSFSSCDKLRFNLYLGNLFYIFDFGKNISYPVIFYFIRLIRMTKTPGGLASFSFILFKLKPFFD